MLHNFAIKQQFPECFPELSVEEILIGCFSALCTGIVDAESMKEKDICTKNIQLFSTCLLGLKASILNFLDNKDHLQCWVQLPNPPHGKLQPLNLLYFSVHLLNPLYCKLQPLKFMCNHLSALQGAAHEPSLAESFNCIAGCSSWTLFSRIIDLYCRSWTLFSRIIDLHCRVQLLNPL